MEIAETLRATDAASMGNAIVEHIRENRLDEAEALLQELNEAHPASKDLLVFPVMIAIQRGLLTEAWQLVNGLPDDQCPELKALCLRRLNDPTWYGYAESCVDHPDPYVRKAMRNLLGRSGEDDIHPLLR
ncbi:HrpB1 family type III secretion system apparatus protein [Paraburkholderia sp.]|uniref:HrpB1 family type III secretion system apparatus protein n=1 Tax=Paraburkholderia sp. TaxID=1926495 RepID=UPI003D6F8F4C